MKHISYWHASGGYTIIIAILLVWFLLVLTTWVFKLVLQEMFDGRGKQNYLKAYAWAESAMELALLEIKNKGYGYYNDSFTNQDTLWTALKDTRIGYELDGKVASYTGSLQGVRTTDIIPLFWIDSAGNTINITSSLTLTSASSELVWNIVSQDIWISWVQSFSPTTGVDKKGLSSVLWNQSFTFSSDDVNGFLSLPWEKYLILYNPTATPITYSLSVWGNQYFTKPIVSIYSRGKIGKYIQNIRTRVDNTEFLWLLRYSIYSWE